MSHRFYPGQFVVCIDDRFPPQVWEWCNQIPKVGERYTVHRLSWSPDGVTGEFGMALVLFELDNPTPRGGQVAFNIQRFKPYEEELESENKSNNDASVTALVGHEG